MFKPGKQKKPEYVLISRPARSPSREPPAAGSRGARGKKAQAPLVFQKKLHSQKKRACKARDKTSDVVIGVVGVRCKRGVRTHTRNDTDFDNKSRRKGPVEISHLQRADSSSCHLCEPLLSLNYSSQYTDSCSCVCALCALCLVIKLSLPRVSYVLPGSLIHYAVSNKAYR